MSHPNTLTLISLNARREMLYTIQMNHLNISCVSKKMYRAILTSYSLPLLDIQGMIQSTLSSFSPNDFKGRDFITCLHSIEANRIKSAFCFGWIRVSNKTAYEFVK